MERSRSEQRILLRNTLKMPASAFHCLKPSERWARTENFPTLKLFFLSRSFLECFFFFLLALRGQSFKLRWHTFLCFGKFPFPFFLSLSLSLFLIVLFYLIPWKVLRDKFVKTQEKSLLLNFNKISTQKLFFFFFMWNTKWEVWRQEKNFFLLFSTKKKKTREQNGITTFATTLRVTNKTERIFTENIIRKKAYFRVSNEKKKANFG